MKKIVIVILILLAQPIQCDTELYRLENSIEQLDTQAVRDYLNAHTISEKRKALITQHTDDLVRLYRPTGLAHNITDLSRFAGGSCGALVSAMVLAVALDKNIIKLSKLTEIKLGGFLTILMVPICGVAGYVSGQLALTGWRLDCARKLFAKAREIQYLVHGVSAEK